MRDDNMQTRSNSATHMAWDAPVFQMIPLLLHGPVFVNVVTVSAGTINIEPATKTSDCKMTQSGRGQTQSD